MSTSPPPSFSNDNEEKHEETSTTDFCDVKQDTDIVAVDEMKSEEESSHGRSSAIPAIQHFSGNKSDTKRLDGPEIVYDVDGFRHDLDDMHQKHDATEDFLKQGGNCLLGADNKAAHGAHGGKAERPEVIYDDDAPFSLESDKLEESDPPIGKSRVLNVAEIGVPSQARSVTRDAPDQSVDDDATGAQRTPSPYMVDAVAVRIVDDINDEETPTEQSKSPVLTNNTKKYWLGVTVAVLFIVAAVVTAVVLTRDEPSPSPTASPSQSPISARNEAITNAIIAVSGDSAVTTTTYQHLALTWLLEEDGLDLSADDPRLIQRYVLALMYYSLGGDDWYDKHLFLRKDANECAWGKNFEYNNNSMITTIDLTDNNLVGLLPSEIRALESLETLNLGENNLFGSIPQTLTSLSTLRYLELRNNSLTGSLPASISDMSSLELLNVYNNQVTGTIPTSIGNIVNLKRLSVCTNKLKGSIPSEIGRLSKLEILLACDNEFTGTFPTTIGQLTSLTSLQAHTSLMHGPIPSGVGRLTNLGLLGFYGNKFTGTLPTEIGQLTGLTLLYAYTNLLGKAIPAEIGNLTKLETLSVYDNKLTGTVPTEIGNLAKLKILSLYDNKLTGTVPTEIGQLSQMTSFYIDGNELTGSVPASICNLNLTYFDADCLSEVNCSCCTKCF